MNQENVDDVITVMNLMKPQVKSGLRRGTVPCPRCQGNVKWQYTGPRASSAKCETPDCTVRFVS